MLEHRHRDPCLLQCAFQPHVLWNRKTGASQWSARHAEPSPAHPDVSARTAQTDCLEPLERESERLCVEVLCRRCFHMWDITARMPRLILNAPVVSSRSLTAVVLVESPSSASGNYSMDEIGFCHNPLRSRHGAAPLVPLQRDRVSGPQTDGIAIAPTGFCNRRLRRLPRPVHGAGQRLGRRESRARQGAAFRLTRVSY